MKESIGHLSYDELSIESDALECCMWNVRHLLIRFCLWCTGRSVAVITQGRRWLPSVVGFVHSCTITTYSPAVHMLMS